MQDLKLSLIQHLDELRVRIFKSFLVIAVCAVTIYNNTGSILAIISEPVGKLVFITPTEAFVSYIKIALWGGLFVASPYVLYQVWQFIGVALHKNEKQYIYMVMPASSALFITGVVFGFFLVIKVGMKFLLSFGTEYMMPMISVSKYVSFIFAMCFAFGLVFQLPLAMIFLARIGLVSPQAFVRKRRYAIVGIFIAAGILTPTPDVFNQFCMALPLLVLYEAGIIVAKLVCRKASAKKEAGQLAEKSITKAVA